MYKWGMRAAAALCAVLVAQTVRASKWDRDGEMIELQELGSSRSRRAAQLGALAGVVAQCETDVAAGLEAGIRAFGLAFFLGNLTRGGVDLAAGVPRLPREMQDAVALWTLLCDDAAVAQAVLRLPAENAVVRTTPVLEGRVRCPRDDLPVLLEVLLALGRLSEPAVARAVHASIHSSDVGRVFSLAMQTGDPETIRLLPLLSLTPNALAAIMNDAPRPLDAKARTLLAKVGRDSPDPSRCLDALLCASQNDAALTLAYVSGPRTGELIGRILDRCGPRDRRLLLAAKALPYEWMAPHAAYHHALLLSDCVFVRRSTRVLVHCALQVSDPLLLLPLAKVAIANENLSAFLTDRVVARFGASWAVAALYRAGTGTSDAGARAAVADAVGALVLRHGASWSAAAVLARERGWSKVAGALSRAAVRLGDVARLAVDAARPALLDPVRLEPLPVAVRISEGATSAAQRPRRTVVFSEETLAASGVGGGTKVHSEPSRSVTAGSGGGGREKTTVAIEEVDVSSGASAETPAVSLGSMDCPDSKPDGSTASRPTIGSQASGVRSPKRMSPDGARRRADLRRKTVRMSMSPLATTGAETDDAGNNSDDHDAEEKRAAVARLSVALSTLRDAVDEKDALAGALAAGDAAPRGARPLPPVPRRPPGRLSVVAPLLAAASSPFARGPGGDA